MLVLKRDKDKGCQYVESLTGQTYGGYQNAAGTESVCLSQVNGEPFIDPLPDQTHSLKKLLYCESFESAALVNLHVYQRMFWHIARTIQIDFGLYSNADPVNGVTGCRCLTGKGVMNESITKQMKTQRQCERNNTSLQATSKSSKMRLS